MNLRFFLVLSACMLLASCTAIDPSTRDLRSPCVSNGFGDDSQGMLIPCEKRRPLENVIV